MTDDPPARAGSSKGVAVEMPPERPSLVAVPSRKKAVQEDSPLLVTAQEARELGVPSEDLPPIVGLYFPPPDRKGQRTTGIPLYSYDAIQAILRVQGTSDRVGA